MITGEIKGTVPLSGRKGGLSPFSTALPGPFPKFEGRTLRCDVAIVGGGFAGLSAALRLLERKPGANIVVLEAGRIGAGASGHTTGMLGPGVGQSLPALVKSRGAEAASALYRATLGAVGDAEALIAREGIDCELERSGQLVIARTAGAEARLHTLAGLLKQLGLPGLLLSAEETRARIAVNGPRASVLLPNAGTLHPGKLLAGLAERVVARGGRILEGARVSKIGHEQPVKLTLEKGDVIADDVVLATAGYTPTLGLLQGRVLPVHLQVLVTEPVKDLAALGWRGREGALDARRVFNYFRLTADDRIVFGGGAPRYRWGGSTEAGDPDFTALEAELRATFPIPLTVAGGWTGVIGYVADALPAIHQWTHNAAVVHAVGWCGHGVALSLASGAWVARLLCDGALPADLPWFRPNPPLVPFEPVRWLTFRAAVGAMSLMDRLGKGGT